MGNNTPKVHRGGEQKLRLKDITAFKNGMIDGKFSAGFGGAARAPGTSRENNGMRPGRRQIFRRIWRRGPGTGYFASE